MAQRLGTHRGTRAPCRGDAHLPLYEVEDGKYRLTVDVDNPRPIEDYLKHQGRFRHLTPDQIRMIQERVYLEYNKLMDKVENLQAWSDLKYDLGLLD